MPLIRKRLLWVDIFLRQMCVRMVTFCTKISDKCALQYLNSCMDKMSWDKKIKDCNALGYNDINDLNPIAKF